MKKITENTRIGMVRQRSISPELSEDQSSPSVLQQTNYEWTRKQYGGRRISRSAPLKKELPDQNHYFIDKTPVNNRSQSNINERQRLNKEAMTNGFDEISSKSKWSTKKKVIVGTSITLAIAAAIAVAVVLGVLLTGSTATTTSTTTASSTVIIAYWSFDNVLNDSCGIYNGQSICNAGFSPNVTSQPYVGYVEALFMNSSMNQSFLVSTPFLDLTFKSFTIEGWIYPTVFSGDRGIFGQCQCSTCINQCLYLMIRATRLYVYRFYIE